jgi:hypothetical protein
MLLITPLVCLAVYFVASKSSRQALACTKVVVATALRRLRQYILAIVALLHRYRAPGLIVDLATALAHEFLPPGSRWALTSKQILRGELYRALHGFNHENMRVTQQDGLSLLMSCSNYYSTLVIIAASTAALICFSALASASPEVRHRPSADAARGGIDNRRFLISIGPMGVAGPVVRPSTLPLVC